MQFVLEDGDGTEVQITKDKEVKFVEGGGIDIDWTDTDNGTDGDPYDLTFTLNAAQTGITSILATDVKIGEDDETKIDFEDANQINFYADNTKRVTIDATGLTVNSGSIETATIDYTDGDNAMTIADGGKVTFAAGFDVGSDASGDILYHNGTSYVRLAKGSDTQVLTLASGVPSWAAASGGDVADDSSPQLGGDLDVVTHSIVTTSDRDVNLVPNGSGSVHVQTTTSANALKITETDAGASQGPTVRLDRNSSSPADSDYIGGIDFYGKNSAAEDHKYASIVGQTSDVTNGTEDGKIGFWGGAVGSLYKAAEVDAFRLKAQYTGQYKNHLTSITASDDATLSLNGYMSTAYKIYEILFVNMVPATNGVDLMLNCGNGGSEITQHYGYYNAFTGSSGSDASQTDSQTTASGTGGMSSLGRWKISGKDEFDVGNTSGEGYTGLVRLYHTQDSGRYVNGHVDHCAYQSDDGYAVNNYLSTFRGNFGSTLVTDINIAFDSGNISSGSMYLYGIYVG